MRVLLFGDFSEALDEGFKNSSHYISLALASKVKVLQADYKKIKAPDKGLSLSEAL